MTSPSNKDDTLKQGAILRGKYRIKRVLGEGGMGRVVRATHLKLDQDVAIKMLKPESMKNERVVARFAREARAAARLKSEHVVRILDVDEQESVEAGGSSAPFIVMEYLDGTDLDRLVRKRGPVSSTRAAELALEACEGLAEAHALGIVHRDVKPANLFLATSQRGVERVKLLDFGISKPPESGEDPTITEADRLLGSPSFMSPEQLKAARDVDARTDVWSLGVVLYFLVSGRLPFEGDSATSVAARIAADPPRPLDDVKDLPRELVTVVMRCLEKDPAARYGSVAALARALAPFAPGGGAAASRVSSALRVPAAAPSSGGASVPVLSSARVTTADRASGGGSGSNQRVTASLSDLVAEAAEERPTDPPSEDERLSQSVDAGSVSSTADRPPSGSEDRERTTAATRQTPRTSSTLLALLAIAAIAAAAVTWLVKSGSTAGPDRNPFDANPSRAAGSGAASPPSSAVTLPTPPSATTSRPTNVAVLTAPSASPLARPVAVPTVAVQAPTAPSARPSVSAASTAAPSADPLKLDLK